MGGSEYLHSSDLKPPGIRSLKFVRRYYKDIKRCAVSIFTSSFGNSDIELSCSNITEMLLNISGPRKQAETT